MKTLILTFTAAALIGLSGPAAAVPSKAQAAIGSPAAQPRSTPISFGSKPKPGTKARCPVMKGEFTIKASSKFSVYKGRYYFFCCPGCKPKFDANPSRYAGR